MRVKGRSFHVLASAALAAWVVPARADTGFGISPAFTIDNRQQVDIGVSPKFTIDNREEGDSPPQPGEDTRSFDLTIHLDRLWVWRADAGRFVKPAPGVGASIDPSKPTYLLTHGWDGALDGSTCGDDGAEDFVCDNRPAGLDKPDYAMSSVGAAIWDATMNGSEPGINLLAWDWKTAANPDSRCDLDELLSLPDGAELLAGVLSHIAQPAMGIVHAVLADTAEDAFDFVRDAYVSGRNVEAEGNALGTALADWIQNNPDVPNPLGTQIHLIGKSHGGGVLGQAARVLRKRGFPPDSLTTLDTPRIMRIPTFLLDRSHLIDSMRFVDPGSVRETGRTAVFYYPNRAKFGFGGPVKGYATTLSNFALSEHQVPWYPLPWPDPAHLWISGYDDCAFDEGWYPVGVGSELAFADTSPAPEVSSVLDVFDMPSGYFAEKDGSGDAYSFVPMGACCHDPIWPFERWCDIRTRADCESPSDPGTYGGDQSNCCNACDVCDEAESLANRVSSGCETVGAATKVSGLSLLRHEPFNTAGIWTSSNGELVENVDPCNASNRVVRLAETAGDASLFRDIAWRQATVELTFDYMFGDLAEDESLTVYWIDPEGQETLIHFDNARTGLAVGQARTAGPLFVGPAAGTLSRLLFVYRGSGSPVGTVWIDNIRVYGLLLGDFDLDGDVDLADASQFLNCFDRDTAGTALSEACWAADLASGAVPGEPVIDRADHGVFIAAQTGPLALLRP